MSGAWAEGNATPAAEFNALNDPEALSVLLACGRPVVFATLELTAQALVTPERVGGVACSGQRGFVWPPRAISKQAFRDPGVCPAHRCTIHARSRGCCVRHCSRRGLVRSGSISDPELAAAEP